MGWEWSMKPPNELEAEALIYTAGQLLSLGLVISARDYLEALHLRAKQDPQYAWWSEHLEAVEAFIANRDYVSAADCLLFEFRPSA